MPDPLASYADPTSGAIWIPVSRMWMPTLHPKHLLCYVDGNSGHEMGSVAALNVPQQVMVKDSWFTIDLAPRGVPITTRAVLLMVDFISSGYLGAPPVSLSMSTRASGYAGLGLGDYFAAVTAAPGGGFRQTASVICPVHDRKIDLSYQQPISTTAAAIAAVTGAPQIISILLQAVFEGDG